jgi:hypothetical protein
MKWLEGKKTYLVMACIIIFGALDAWNEYCGNSSCKVIEIPTFVFSLLGALGIYTRSQVKK